MKKILLPPDIITLLVHQENFLNRADLQIFTADSHEEVLEIHRSENLNLIINHFTTLGMSSEHFCSTIRADKDLSRVSVILICPKINEDMEISARCKANAIMTKPVDPAALLGKAWELLNIPCRAGYRVLMNVTIDGTFGNSSFFCRLINISTSGMLVKTEQVLARGDKMECSFFLPSGIQIKTTAEVVRKHESRDNGTGDFKYGVKFTKMAAHDKRALEGFIQKKITPQPQPADQTCKPNDDGGKLTPVLS